MKNKKITIQLSRGTGERIKLLSITPRESYDKIINRILNERITIQLNRGTDKKIKLLGITPEESYDEIINRIINKITDRKKIPKQVKE